MRVFEDSAKVNFPPPLIYLGVLLLGLAYTGLTGHLGPAGPISIVTSGIFLVAGIAVILAASIRFLRAHTETRPWLPATALVTTGIYRFTRNPMYLGMTLIYAGLAILFDSFAAIVLLPVPILTIQILVIGREERYLLRKFGADYAAYMVRVGRWF